MVASVLSVGREEAGAPTGGCGGRTRTEGRRDGRAARARAPRRTWRGAWGTLRSSRMMCARSERASERGGSVAELGWRGCSPSVGRG